MSHFNQIGSSFIKYDYKESEISSLEIDYDNYYDNYYDMYYNNYRIINYNLGLFIVMAYLTHLSNKYIIIRKLGKIVCILYLFYKYVLTTFISRNNDKLVIYKEINYAKYLVNIIIIIIISIIISIIVSIIYLNNKYIKRVSCDFCNSQNYNNVISVIQKNVDKNKRGYPLYYCYECQITALESIKYFSRYIKNNKYEFRIIDATKETELFNCVLKIMSNFNYYIKRIITFNDYLNINLDLKTTLSNLTVISGKKTIILTLSTWDNWYIPEDAEIE